MSKSYYPIVDKYYITRPSFTEGMARILDIGGTMTPRIKVQQSRKIRRNSYEAISSYWESVGSHLYNAIDDYESFDNDS